MNKKALLFLCIFILCMTNIQSVYAKELNVTDCINQEEGCIDGFDTPATEGMKEDTKVDTKELGGNTSSLFVNIIKMVVALIFVLGLIYGFLFLIKRKNNFFQRDGVIENITGLSVGQQKSIQIIKVGNAMYMIGVGDNIEMLKEITDPQVKENLLQSKEEQISTPSFLPKFLKQKEHSVSSNELKGNSLFVDKFQQELAKMKENRFNMGHNLAKKDDDNV